MGARNSLWVWGLALLLASAGCDCGREGSSGDGGLRDGASEDEGGRSVPECRAALPIDMVWVIDNSHSMRQEQESLAFNFPRIIEALTNPPDKDGDGEPDVPPVTDLRTAVVTTDMGVGDNDVGFGCDERGDDGSFIGESRHDSEDCSGLTVGPPPWFQYQQGDDAAPFNEKFECIAQLGTDGCGLEQPLEASYQAVVNKTKPGGPHADFLRSNSLVAVVYVTDEDDCSARDEAIFDPSAEAERELGPLRTRCALHPEFLHDIERYIDGFESLTVDRKGDVLLVAISGVPRELTDDPTRIDYEALLEDERMQYRVNEEEDKLVPACKFEGAGSADPARRIVRVVRHFAERGDGLTMSICQPDLTPALEAIAELVAARLCPKVD